MLAKANERPPYPKCSNQSPRKETVVTIQGKKVISPPPPARHILACRVVHSHVIKLYPLKPTRSYRWKMVLTFLCHVSCFSQFSSRGSVALAQRGSSMADLPWDNNCHTCLFADDALHHALPTAYPPSFSDHFVTDDALHFYTLPTVDPPGALPR